jgi:hypothetical protein
MPSWGHVLAEVQKGRASHDAVRAKYLSLLSRHTGRNVIAYYSAWLQKPEAAAGTVALNDTDKTGFMSTVQGLDRAKGLDLLLHTPGGEVAATESIVDYLHQMFGDIRAIVPQLAMSAGTMISLACDTIVLGKHSSLGPFDPQIRGMPAQGILEEFQTAVTEIKANPAAAPLWQVIIAKYPPTLLGQSQKASQWAEQMVADWMIKRLLSKLPNKEAVKASVLGELGKHGQAKAHNRHYSADQIRQLGVPIVALEDDDRLQDLVLSTHHAFTITMAETAVVKVIQNQTGTAYVSSLNLRGGT